MVYEVQCNKSTTEKRGVFTCENYVRIKVVYLIHALKIGHISKYLKKNVFVKNGCSRRQQSQNLAKLSKSYI